MNAAFYGATGHKPKPPLIPRGPLPPFPQPITYPDTLSFVPPTGPDIYFYRGQFCGLRVKGAPPVPGSNPANPECVMACLLDNYPDWVVDEFFRLYCGYGYTHLQRSLGHALYYTSFDRFQSVSRKARELGLFLDVWFIAGEFPGFQFNQDASFWGPKLQPYIDQLLGSGLIDLACPSWQMDQVMVSAPGNTTISVIAYVADALPKTVPVYTHWVNEALAWWKTGGELWTDKYGSIWVANRFDWWRAMAPYLTGGHYQGSGSTALYDPKLYQDRMRDTLDPFNGDYSKGNMGQSLRTGTPKNYLLDAFEATGQGQFDGWCEEIDGDMAGWLQMCTISVNGGHMGGYGNGARRPDGGVL